MPHSMRQTDPNQTGVTVTELLVVVVVISVLIGFAIIQRGSTDQILRRQNAAQELKSSLERARFDSVKRRADVSSAQANVVITATSVTLTTDRDMNGVLDAADQQVRDFAGSNIVFAGDHVMTFPITVSYNQRGEATATDAGGPVEPVFLVCNSSCDSPDVNNSNILLVTPTGTVNLLPGGTALPTFSPPGGISTIPPSNSINNSAAITPTPTP